MMRRSEGRQRGEKSLFTFFLLFSPCLYCYRLQKPAM